MMDDLSPETLFVQKYIRRNTRIIGGYIDTSGILVDPDPDNDVSPMDEVNKKAPIRKPSPPEMSLAIDLGVHGSDRPARYLFENRIDGRTYRVDKIAGIDGIGPIVGWYMAKTRGMQF